MAKILLVDKNYDDVEQLRSEIRYEGYETVVEDNFEEGLKVLKRDDFDGVIVGIEPEDEDAGFEFLKDVRKFNREIPIIVLSSLKSLQDKIYALNIGADDYVEKPFSEYEIIARLKAQIRKVNSLKAETGLATIVFADESHSYGTIGNAKINFDRMVVKVGNEEIFLTNKEASILSLLYRNRGKVVSRETMMKEIWGGDEYTTERVIDTNIVSIRKKIGDVGKKPKYIKTVFGVGYKLVEEE